MAFLFDHVPFERDNKEFGDHSPRHYSMFHVTFLESRPKQECDSFSGVDTPSESSPGALLEHKATQIQSHIDYLVFAARYIIISFHLHSELMLQSGWSGEFFCNIFGMSGIFVPTLSPFPGHTPMAPASQRVGAGSGLWPSAAPRGHLPWLRGVLIRGAHFARLSPDSDSHKKNRFKVVDFFALCW